MIPNINYNKNTNTNILQKAFSTLSKSMNPINEPPISGSSFPINMFNMTASGVSVTSRTSLQHHAVYTCVRTLTSDIAKIPIRLEKKVNNGWVEDNDHELNKILQAPNNRLVPFEFVEMIVQNVLTAGDSFVVVIRDKQGRPTDLIPMRSYSTSVIEDQKDGELYYQVSDNQLNSRKTSIASETGPVRTIYHSDMIRTRNLSLDGGVNGVPITQLASETFGLALATQETAARAYANGAHINGYFRKTPGTGSAGKAQTEADKEAISRAIQTVANAGRVAVINDVDWVPVSSNVGELQLIEARKQITVEIANIYKIPLHKIGLSDSEKAANISEQEESYITNTLTQYTKPLEQHMDRVLLNDIEKNNYRLRFDFSKQAEPNKQIRGSYYKDGLNYGWLTQNEVRQMEDLAPKNQEGADELRIPLNTGVAGSEDPMDLNAKDNNNDKDSNNNNNKE